MLSTDTVDSSLYMLPRIYCVNQSFFLLQPAIRQNVKARTLLDQLAQYAFFTIIVFNTTKMERATTIFKLQIFPPPLQMNWSPFIAHTSYCLFSSFLLRLEGDDRTSALTSIHNYLLPQSKGYIPYCLSKVKSFLVCIDCSVKTNSGNGLVTRERVSKRIHLLLYLPVRRYGDTKNRYKMKIDNQRLHGYKHLTQFHPINCPLWLLPPKVLPKQKVAINIPKYRVLHNNTVSHNINEYPS